MSVETRYSQPMPPRPSGPYCKQCGHGHMVTDFNNDETVTYIAACDLCECRVNGRDYSDWTGPYPAPPRPSPTVHAQPEPVTLEPDPRPILNRVLDTVNACRQTVEIISRGLR